MRWIIGAALALALCGCGHKCEQAHEEATKAFETYLSGVKWETPEDRAKQLDAYRKDMSDFQPMFVELGDKNWEAFTKAHAAAKAACHK